MTNITKYQGKIPKEDINALPLRGWDGEIRLIREETECIEACEDLASNDVLGFDTESRPAFKKGRYYLPSLVQLGTAKTVYLFQLSVLGFPEELKGILADKQILKTGVATRDDVKDLQKLSHFKPAGFLDLGQEALQMKLETHGLRNLAAKFLGFRISKAARCSNWANKTLTKQQIKYAATDAFVSREIYVAMKACGLFR